MIKGIRTILRISPPTDGFPGPRESLAWSQVESLAAAAGWENELSTVARFDETESGQSERGDGATVLRFTQSFPGHPISIDRIKSRFLRTPFRPMSP
jgi:hypothetical protein